MSTPEHRESFIPVDVAYVEGGRWNTVQVTWNEYVKMLQTGELDGQKICAVSVNEATNENEDGTKDVLRVVYDFVLMHTGRNPWRFS